MDIKKIGLVAALPLLLATSYGYASATDQQQTAVSSIIVVNADDTVQRLSSDLEQISSHDYDTVNEQLTFNWNNNIP